MIFAHAFIGLIIGYFLTIKPINSKLYTKEKRLLYIFIAGIIGSIFPDFDFVFVFLLHNKDLHRHLLTHSLISYIIVLVGFSIFKYVRKRSIDDLWQRIFWAFWLGAVIHLFADLIATPVYLFEPISNISMVLHRFRANETDGLRKYIFSPYMINEIIVIITGLVLLIMRFKNCKKELMILLGLLGTILLMAMIVLVPFF